MRLPLSTPALAAGALFAVTAAIDIPHDQASTSFAGTLDYVLEIVFSFSMAAAAVASWGLTRVAATRLARSGWSALGVGYTLLTAVTAATAVNGGDVLGPVFGLALLAIGLGSLVLAGADLAGRLVPRGAGLVVLIGLVAMVVLGEGYGLLAWSAAWFATAALTAQLPRTSRDRIRASSASRSVS